MVYSDSESEEEEHGNGDVPQPSQLEVDQLSKEALQSGKPSFQQSERMGDQEGCVQCHVTRCTSVGQ